MENTNTPAPDAQDVEKGKTIAILSYLTLIGWIIAYVMHSSTKTKFGAFHLRQGLGLMILGVGAFFLSIGFIFFPWYLYTIIQIIYIGIFVLAIMGLINAANGKMVGIPLLGDFCNKTFSSIN